MSYRPQGLQRNRQRGQALIWFLATAAACCCIFALVYNVGQAANSKEATVNAADAAALSGALVEARMLNFVAYTNRAVIANEVTVAQLVSSVSFMNYGNQIVQTIETYAQFVPIVDDFTGPLAQGSQFATDIVDASVQGLITESDVLAQELSADGLAAFAVGASAANDISGQIAGANSTSLTAGGAALVVNEIKWNAFAETSSSSRATGKNLVLESRDPFSTQRKNGYLIDAINAYLDLGGVAAVLAGGGDYLQLDKTSGITTLDDSYDHWTAQDSLDLDDTKIISVFGFPVPVATINEPVDIGYGRADADPGSSVGDVRCDKIPGFGIFKSSDPTHNCNQAHDNAQSYVWSGLPQLFLDLASGLSKKDPCSVNNGSDSPSVPYVMAVQKAGNTTATTQNLGLDTVDVPGPQGSTQTSDNFQNGGNLTAVSAACAFFLRPDPSDSFALKAGLPRLDGVHEFASLYNPYWQARLTAPDPSWVSAVYAAIGKPGLNVATQ